MLSERELEELKTVALLHDIGKTMVPRELLNKTTTLSKEEIVLLKNHSIYGANIMKGNCPRSIYDGIKSHHEFFSGNGYPDKLKGEDIPIYSRIIAIADAFDAMTNSRPYRKNPLQFDEAWGEIEIHSERQFDPYIVKRLAKPEL